jgi:hypothetical protein
MATDWHPANGFDALVLHLFTGAGFAGCTDNLMANRDIVNIGIRVIKQCGLFTKEYKVWIARKAVTPKINETFDTFKSFWATKIMLVNQMSIPASMHGYRMAAVNKEDSFILYGELIANFGAVYAATQKLLKNQGSTIALMQAQLQALQQYCMELQQQPPPATYAPQQQQHGRRGSLHCTFQGSGGGRIARIYSRQRRANIRCSPPRFSSATRIGTTVGCMVATLTTTTPAGRARSRDHRTILLQRGQTQWEVQRQASTR